MDIERGIETQRLKLLRLLAGWVFAVAFLSVAPIAPAWSRWVREAVFSMLQRAEAAALNLVFAQACLLARVQGGTVDRAVFARAAFAGCSDELPSLDGLRRRLKALQRLLENLPRHAMRLVRRCNPTRTSRGSEARTEAPIVCRASVLEAGRVTRGFAPGLWHLPRADCLSTPFRAVLSGRT